jgi:hypothetical protein
MRLRSIKFAALLLASAAALALSSALPAQSLPQWVTIKGEAEYLLYNFNSLKSLPNDVKQVDVYYFKENRGYFMYISCPKWRYTVAGHKMWWVIPPGDLIEVLAYKLCKKSRAYTRSMPDDID